MANRNLTLVPTVDPDDLEMADAEYIASLERAIDDLMEVNGKLNYALGVAHRELRKERERRATVEIARIMA